MSETKRQNVRFSYERVIRAPSVANSLIPTLRYDLACLVVGSLSTRFRHIQPLLSTVIVGDIPDDVDTNVPLNCRFHNLDELYEMLQYNAFLDKLRVIYYANGNRVYYKRTALCQFEWPTGHRNRVRRFTIIPPAMALYGAFKNVKCVTDVILPSTLWGIDDWTFANCSNLENVDTNKAPLEAVGTHAFIRCTSLLSIDLSNRPLKTIGPAAFDGCKRLESVDISNTSLEKIAKSVFNSCHELRHLNMANNMQLTCIDNFACAGCGLRDIDMSHTGVERIGYRAFAGCKSLITVIFPASLRRIELEAFSYCTSLATVDLSDTQVTLIGKGAFNNCSSLRTVILPVNDIDIRANAFPSGVNIIRT